MNGDETDNLHIVVTLHLVVACVCDRPAIAVASAHQGIPKVVDVVACDMPDERGGAVLAALTAAKPAL